MGIKFKDLTVGAYYKGYHQPAPTGLRCFYYVVYLSKPTSAGLMDLEVVWHYRDNAIPSGWFRQLERGYREDESLLKRQCTGSDLKTEGILFPVLNPQVVLPPAPVVGYPATLVPLVAPKQTEAERLAVERAKRNEGKVIIPENARSPRCVRCGMKNREVAMFTFSSFICDHCEPV